jgi:hypothetical protein
MCDGSKFGSVRLVVLGRRMGHEPETLQRCRPSTDRHAIPLSYLTGDNPITPVILTSPYRPAHEPTEETWPR